MVDKKKILRYFNLYFEGFNISEENIDDDGLFNSSESVKMTQPATVFRRLPVRFGVIRQFKAVDKQLTTLDGSPQYVHREFDVDSNPLGSNGLRGGPQQVGGNYWCNHCSLTTLEGAPKRVGEGFYCSDTQLQNLLGAPESVGDAFFCVDNPLKSLEGLPKIIPGELRLTYHPELPLLRTLVAQMVTFSNYLDDRVSDVQSILEKYAGQGRAAVIDCKRDLVASGFEGNARW